MNPAFPIDPEYLELDRELASLAWTGDELTPRDIPVEELTERALFEYSLRSLGDFAFVGLGGSLADLAAALLGGKPPGGRDDYQI
ncbi:MAG: hypothetical protein QM627_01650 [Luteolibacter sp.]